MKVREPLISHLSHCDLLVAEVRYSHSPDRYALVFPTIFRANHGNGWISTGARSENDLMQELITSHHLGTLSMNQAHGVGTQERAVPHSVANLWCGTVP